MTDAPTPTPHVLVVTSAGAPAAVVVPVLAACEAAGMRVHAIDVGAAGGGGVGVADRVRRALLGEGAERRLKKELEQNPPDVAIAFDPAATTVLTVARDSVGASAPVIAVVADLEPGKTWGEAGADRYCAIDSDVAVALADLGIEGERVLVVGPIGPRAWVDAAIEPRDALRTRYKLGGQVALIEVAGMGAEGTSAIAMQLSLAELSEHTTFLFDAGNDVDAAAVLRAKVPILGLRAKLFGATSTDAPHLWRCADVVVARPRHETIAKTTLVGARLVALVDDTMPGAARAAAALEARKQASVARSPLLIAPAIEAMLKLRGGAGQPDGAEAVADVAWIVAGDRRAVLEERRAAEHAEVREKVRAATTAAQAAARVAAAPGELEDLGGSDPAPAASAPDPGDLARLVAETQARKKDMERAMMAARDSAERWSKKAEAAVGDSDRRDARARADAERAQMNKLLVELGGLETELRELERAVGAARSAPGAATASSARAAPPPRSTLDDQLEQLKRQQVNTPAPPPPSRGKKPAAGESVEDALAALKRKMEQDPKKKS